MSFWLVFETIPGSRYATPRGFRWILFTGMCVVSLLLALAVANARTP